jgi:hypothetical protein
VHIYQGGPLDLKRLKQVITLVALGLALVHLVWPSVAVDSITIILLVVAIIPWLSPIFESIELPGGWKIKFRDLQKAADRADSAGLLAPISNVTVQTDFTFQSVADQDPNLALAGLRIEIEKRLMNLAKSKGIDSGRAGIGYLLRELSQKQILTDNERSVLSDMVGLLNNAVHGAKVDHRAASWAMDVGPRLLKALDERIEEPKEGK